MMRNLFASVYRSVAAGILIGSFSLLIPLLRDLHWESAGLASLAAAFYAAVDTAGGKHRSHTVFRNVSGLVLGWMLPLILFASFTDCLSTGGLGYWVFGPFPSMLTGWAIGRLTRHFQFTHAVSTAVIILLMISVIPPFIEFTLFPQLYFFNHVWSYWPGPIYDELVPFDPRLILFRGITFLWVVVLWSITDFFRRPVMRLLTILGLSVLLFSYLHIPDWGLIAPEERIQNELGALHKTDHFNIWYAAGTLSPAEQQELGKKHEKKLHQIIDNLDINPDVYLRNPIHSYIYADIYQKKRLTGAGQTSYVPVWIRQDQTHIAAEHVEWVLQHELVHIVAKQFGNWFGASTSIGLVEGLAVALEPERYQSSADQLVAALDEWPDSEDLRQIFSFTGFYSQAGPVSYVVSGSFVQFLLDFHPVSQFRQAYRSGDIERGYNLSIDELTDSWHKHLQTVDVDVMDQKRSEELFRTPSIFNKPCPRVEKKRNLREQIGHAFPSEIPDPDPGC